MGPDNRRILVAALASIAILVLWQLLFKPAPAPAPPPPAAPAAKAPPKAPPTPAPEAAAPPPGLELPEETAVLETAEFRATLTSRGGALKSFQLKNPKFQHEEKGAVRPVDLVRVAPGSAFPFALSASPELGGRPEAGSFRIAARDERGVTFEGRAGGATVRKRFAAGARPYELSLLLQVNSDRPGAVDLLAPGFLPPDAPKPSFFSGGAFVDILRPICRAGEKTERFSGDKAEERAGGPVGWAGLEQFYFVVAALPEKPAGECRFLRGPGPGQLTTALRLPVEGTLEVGFTLYLGPKQRELLKAHGRHLEEAIDYGAIVRYFAFFAEILMWLMGRFQAFVRNWGVAIILLTVTVKVLLFPLTLKSLKSMAEMRKLQPEIEKLREKLKEDKEQLNLAVMKLYQEHKVNPLGGCLPLLLQMPIFFALWAALQTSVELYREPFLWIHDLSVNDPIYVLPLVMGGSMFLMQKLSPQPADSTQAKVLLYFMPVFFTFIMFQLPAGLALYSVVNNILSIGQQQVLMKRMGPPQPVPAGRQS